MTQVTITVNEILDRSADQLPWLRRKIAKRRLRNDEYREAAADELRLKLCEDEECKEMGLAPVFGSEAIGNDTPFAIDLDKLERLFQIALKYLPQFLDIILPLFTSILIFLIASVFIG